MGSEDLHHSFWIYDHAVEGQGTDHCTNITDNEYEHVPTEGGKEVCRDKAM